MDNIFEKATHVLGSTAVIGLFGLWLITHTFIQKDYLSFISELAIWVGFLILRGQNIQSERMERNLRQTKRDTKKDLDKSDTIISMLKKG